MLSRFPWDERQAFAVQVTDYASDNISGWNGQTPGRIHERQYKVYAGGEEGTTICGFDSETEKGCIIRAPLAACGHRRFERAAKTSSKAFAIHT